MQQTVPICCIIVQVELIDSRRSTRRDTYLIDSCRALTAPRELVVGWS